MRCSPPTAHCCCRREEDPRHHEEHHGGDTPVAAAQPAQEAPDTGAIILTASPAELSALERLRILRIFRADRVSTGVTPLVTQVLCEKYGPTILPSA